MKTCYRILFWILVLNNFIFSQNYLWPTNASHHLTSSFCEYRPGHYHSAIDIKTWNKEGYPIYAIEDGRVYKIRVSPFGYGKVIYLLLDDGNYAVYAHLQKFTKELAEVVREKQLASKKYRLNWYPKKWKVKKGDIIGYTGSTGIGTPHLHFEIRNSKEQPLNPLAFYTQVKDNIRPKLQKLAVIPVSTNATINSSYLLRQFDLKYIKDGIYVIRKPIKINGKVGLALKGYDKADGVHNKFAFYKTTMSIDGIDVFQIAYDKMDFASTSYIDTEIYYPLRARNREVFHKLYVEPFNILPFYRHFPDTDGTIKIEEKPVPFTITVEDYSGNTSKIIGELLPAEKEEIFVEQKFIKSEWAYLKFRLSSFNFLSFSTSSNLKNWKDASYFEILDRKFENPDHRLFTKIKLPDSTDKYLKIMTKSYDDRKLQKIVSITQTDSFYKPQVFIADKKLIIETNHIGSEFVTKSNNAIEKLIPHQDISGRSQFAIPINRFAYPDFQLGYNSNDSTTWLDKSDISLFPSNEKKSAAWFDSTFIVSSRSDSFFDSTLIQVKKTKPDSIDFGIPIIDDIYEIYPDDIALLNSASILIKTDTLSENKNWGVFKLNGGENLSFVSSNYDSLKNEFKFRTKSFGKYMLAKDTLSPELEVISPSENKSYNQNPKIRFKLIDEHSGIGHEENISISIDSLFVLPEWDPEEKTISAKIDGVLSSGEHELIITAKDQLNNSVSQNINFRITKQ